MITIETNKPVAYDSPDHQMPHGTKDNSTLWAFNVKLKFWLGNVRLLDLGCAGGGVVESINRHFGFAVGVEGSDYCKKRDLHAWGRIPTRLFTADITQPFRLLEDSQLLQFNVITAWEVLEHIRADDLDVVFDNIDRHLERSGVVMFSVTPRKEVINGVRLHQNLNPKEWWIKKFQERGFIHQEEVKKYFGKDWVRGEGYIRDPHSFNVVLTRKDEPLPNEPKLKRLAKIGALLKPVEEVIFNTQRAMAPIIPRPIKRLIKNSFKLS